MVFQYRPQWVLPGAGFSESVFHIESGAVNLQGAVDALRAWFDTVNDFLPNEVVVNFPAEVSDLNTASGELEGIEVVTPPPSVTGAGVGVWVGGAGLLTQWNTGDVRDGVRVRGRTFLVPATAVSFEADGTPLPGTINGLVGAGNTLLVSMSAVLSNLVVYSRFRPAAPGPPPVTERDGAEFFVTSASCPNRSAILRERRDA